MALTATTKTKTTTKEKQPKKKKTTEVKKITPKITSTKSAPVETVKRKQSTAGEGEDTSTTVGKTNKPRVTIDATAKDLKTKSPKAVSSQQPPAPNLISANTKAKHKTPVNKKSPPTKADAKQKKAKSPSPVLSSSEDEDHDENEKDEDNEDEPGASSDAGEDHLHGFSTDDDDSSDEDVSTEKGLPSYEISKLPTVAKDDESVKRKLEKAKRQPTEDRGVVYIGRLPHGFYEDQLRGYFSQFGDISRLRLSGNKKTGKCKHYGFIEFSSSSVAQIVAETMDNYLLTGHILKCKLIPKDEVHPELWVGANRKWRVVPRDRIVRMQQNKSRTEEEQVKATRRLLKRQNERKRKLEALGIEYDLDAVSYKKPKEGGSA